MDGFLDDSKFKVGRIFLELFSEKVQKNQSWDFLHKNSARVCAASIFVLRVLRQADFCRAFKNS